MMTSNGRTGSNRVGLGSKNSDLEELWDRFIQISESFFEFITKSRFGKILAIFSNNLLKMTDEFVEIRVSD